MAMMFVDLVDIVNCCLLLVVLTEQSAAVSNSVDFFVLIWAPA